MSTPLLSVRLITYNHCKYIKEAIDGVLSQKVNFEWELIIADDFSTDGTRETILEYKKKYPDFIKLILQAKNIGAAKNWHDLIATSKSKYLAYFEGDDYWTDPFKLQKQVDFLEANEEYSICFHPVENFFQNASLPPYIFPNKNKWKESFSIEELINDNFMNTCSVLYRWQFCDDPLPDWIYSHFTGDYQLHLLHTHHGKIGMIPEIMARYRIHSHGIWSSTKKQKIIEKLKDRISLLEDFNAYTCYSYNDRIRISQNKYKLALIHCYLNEKQRNNAKELYLSNKPNITFINKAKFNFHYYFRVIYSFIQWIKHYF